MSKVDKSVRRSTPPLPRPSQTPAPNRGYRGSFSSVQCFYGGRLGHLQSRCFKRLSDLQFNAGPSKRFKSGRPGPNSQPPVWGGACVFLPVWELYGLIGTSVLVYLLSINLLVLCYIVIFLFSLIPYFSFKAAGDKLLMNKFMRQNFGGGLTLKNFISWTFGSWFLSNFTESLENDGNATRLFLIWQIALLCDAMSSKVKIL